MRVMRYGLYVARLCGYGIRNTMQCPSCHRDLTDSEPVHLVHRVSLSWQQTCSVTRLVCRACAAQIGKYCEWQTPRTCEGCGRVVVHDTRRSAPEHAICGEACRRSVRASLARERRQRRRRPRVCLCGIKFKPQRSDAVFCSSTCRQRAYRQRLAATGLATQP